jgi:hypothetical protein
VKCSDAERNNNTVSRKYSLTANIIIFGAGKKEYKMGDKNERYDVQDNANIVLLNASGLS